MPWIYNLKYRYRNDISSVPGFPIFRCILHPCVALDVMFRHRSWFSMSGGSMRIICFPGRHQRRAILADLDDKTHFSIHPLTQTRVVAMCVLCFLPIHSGHQWTYQPGSHRRKVTQDFSSTFFLRCVPLFFSREGFSHSFPSSTVKSIFAY